MKKPMHERSAVCEHREDQRSMIGTWCTPELEKVLELGYEIEHMYEIWHFPETQEGLFKAYVNKWLKLKKRRVFVWIMTRSSTMQDYTPLQK